MRKKNFGLLASGLLLAGMTLSGDTIVFRNGSRLEGAYLGGDNRVVRFATADRVNTYNLSDVESVRFSGASGGNSQAYPPAASGGSYPSGAPAPNGPYNSQPPNYNSQQGPVNAPGSAPINAPSNAQGNAQINNGDGNSGYNNAGLQVPSGTMLTVRLIDSVDSQNDQLGQSYRASLDQPVVVNGQTLIPRGADVVATLIDEQKSGKIQGRASLTLDLKSVTVNGKQYDITTTGVSEESASRGAKSAKVIGGTAALGAIIGAVAGGGKGAAIGAGSGAAAGTAAQVITKGQRVKVPAETRLSFTLQNPINM